MKAPLLREIAPGVSAFSVKTNRFKTCRVSFCAVIPFERDISDNFAAAALLPYLLRRSCAAYPDFSMLNGKLDELYGAKVTAGVIRQGDARVITMSVTALDDRFSLSGDSISDDAAGLLFNMVFEPFLENGFFSEKEVESEKTLMLQRLEDEKSEKRVYAFNRCVEIMFEGEKYSKNRLGTPEEISALTPEILTAAWHKLLKTARIRFSVISSSDSSETEKYLAERFASIDRDVSDFETRFVPAAEKVIEHTDQQSVKQGKLVMGFRAGTVSRTDNNPAVTVMADLFGGGTYSKLFSNVREKMSLCYYCSASFNKNKGVIFVQSGIETQNAEKTRDAVLDQLDDIKNGKITDEDLDFSKRSFLDRLAGYYDTPETLEAWYAAQIFDEKLKTTDERADEINAVTLPEVIQAANKVTLDTVYMLKSDGKGGAEDENQ